MLSRPLLPHPQLPHPPLPQPHIRVAHSTLPQRNFTLYWNSWEFAPRSYIALPLPHPCLTLPGKVRVNFSSLSLSRLSLVSLVSEVGHLLLIIYNFTEHKDNNTKLSGYDPWGQTRSSLTSSVTLSSKSPVRNPQRPPCTTMKDPPFLTHFQ